MDVNSFVLGMKAGKTPSQEKEITVTDNGTTEVTPDEGKLLSKVTVNTNIEGVFLGIHYSEDTPPNDSSKVWVKCPKPQKVSISQSPIFIKDITHTSVLSTSSSSGLSALPYRLNKCGSAVYGETIYLFGGVRYNEETSATEDFTKILAYDTRDNTCRELTEEMPGAFSNMFACVTVGDYIYVLYDSTSMLRFNPATETFDDTIDLGIILGSYKYADSIGNKIYIYSDKNLSVFDFATGLVTSIGSPTYGGVVVAVGNKVFMSSDGGISCYDTVLETMTTAYGPDNTNGDKIKGTETYATFGGREIFFGGYSRNSIIYRYDIYDSVISNVSGISSQTGSYPYYYVMKTVGDYIYLFGGIGTDSLPNKYSNRVQKITMPLGEVEAEPGELILWPDSTYGIPGEIIASDFINMNIGFGRFFYGDENGVGKAVDAYVYKNGSWEFAFRRY